MNRMSIGTIALLLAALPVGAQQPRVSNAHLETRSAAAGLERTFRGIVEGQAAPAWIGYAVPMARGDRRVCCGDWKNARAGAEGCCRLERNDEGFNISSDDESSVKLEGPAYLLVLFRAEGRRVSKIRSFSESCELDAGGLPFVWLTGVRPAESVALLSSFASAAAEEEGKRPARQALAAIALHADRAADAALEGFTAPGRPERLRKEAVFWLGAERGRRGYEVLRRLVREESSEKVREQAIFALSISKEPAALDAMIDAARHDRSSHVRGQALFWLGQKAGQKAAAAINEAIENDPDTDIKKKAVFALSQLPKDEGVPRLIQLARTHRNPAVRKQAIFWLGQSNDARALAFFEEILKP